MVQKVQVLLVDDLDGAPADETVTFALDGVSYEIDLTSAHAAELRDALGSWVGHARKVGGGRSTTRSAPRARSGRSSSDADVIRQWARDNGHQVSDRGRISESVRSAYAAAH